MPERVRKVRCPECRGTGAIKHWMMHRLVYSTCPMCHGKGRIRKDQQGREKGVSYVQLGLDFEGNDNG